MLLPFAIVSIILALIFYAISIYQELVKKVFTLKIIILFWIGLTFDLTGTILMFLIAEGFSMDTHAIIGLVALVLMGIKAMWVLVRFKKGMTIGVPKIYTLISSLMWLTAFFMGFMR